MTKREFVKRMHVLLDEQWDRLTYLGKKELLDDIRKIKYTDDDKVILSMIDKYGSSPKLTEEPLASDCTGEIIRKDEYRVHGSSIAYISDDRHMFDTKEERDARNKLLKEQERRSSIFFKLQVWLKGLFS